MVAGDGASGSILRVVVGDDEAVDGEGKPTPSPSRGEGSLISLGIGGTRHTFGEAVDDGLHVFLSWVLNEFALYGVEAEGIEPFHTGTP